MNWRRRNEELDEEIRAHLAMAVADRMARGESRAEAERNARREFGNQTFLKELTREMWGWTALDRFRQDIRYALRQMRRSPGFTVVAVLTLALGLGAATAMFSIVNGVLLEPLQFHDPGRLFVARTVPTVEVRALGDFPTNARHFAEWRAHCRSCESVSLIQMVDLTLVGAGEPVKLYALQVSSNFFRTLGVQPALGRDFLPQEERGLGQVILSDSLWRSRFRADPAILGRAIQLNGEPHEVIGIMPRHLVLPRGDQWGRLFGPAEEPLIFEPLGFDPSQLRGDNLNYTSVIRLKPGVSREQATAELNALLADFMREHQSSLKIVLIPMLDQVTRNARTSLWLLLGAVGAVLLIVCVNIGNLMLVRTAGRYREAGVRLALGASRARLFGQALKEALVLVTLGGGLGLLLASAGLRLFTAAAPIDLPRLEEARMDWRVLAFGLAAAAFSTVACGLLPAWNLARTQPLDSLKASTGATEAGRKLRFRELLVSLEVALSTVLLSAAGLLLVSFVKVMHVDKGFQTERVVTQDISFLSPKYAHGGRDRVLRLMLEQLARIPGVRAVGATSRLPLTGEDWVANLHDPDSSRPERDEPLANFRFVTPDYWRAMGIPLLRGRFFRDNEWSQQIAVVSEGAARFLWPGQDPIGRHVRGLGGGGPAFEVVGVVGEVPAGPLDQNWPTMVYTPYSFGSPVGVSLALRTAGDPASAIRAARTILAGIDPEMALPPAQTMAQILDASIAARSFEMRLAMAFALAALLLATLGIYGVISFSMARRKPEIGIRIALGARPGQVMAMVLRQGMRPVLPGLLAGMAGAAAGTRLLAGELYQVAPGDPRPLVAVSAALLAAALCACWIPARRSAATDPLTALRAE